MITDTGSLAEAISVFFAAEGFLVKSYSALDKVPAGDYVPQKLALVDVEHFCCEKLDELKLFLATRKGVSMIAMCDPGKISNSRVAELLEAGADDFISPTIDRKVLLAKIRAHLRRFAPPEPALADELSSKDGRMHLDRRKHLVKVKENGKGFREINTLTQKEFDLLAMLLRREEQVLSRTDILGEIWREKAESVNTETVDKHVESLRRKLGPLGKRIKTVYGMGYALKP